MLALPFINLITGLTVAALTSSGGGGADLGLDVAIALGVATTVALELTVLLTRSIMRPIADLQRATEALTAGDYEVTVPVTTGDELGELGGVVQRRWRPGLAERQRLRDAFGTYLDSEVAEYILSEGFSEEGDEVEVSILFCDVRDFTRFAAGAERQGGRRRAQRPVRGRRPDHRRSRRPRRQVRGRRPARRVRRAAALPRPRRPGDRGPLARSPAASTARAPPASLRVGVGVNSGTVVAGSIGGGGRLNFSVIGDAVNVASRVEAATREIDEDVLITAETRARLGTGLDSRSVGCRQLKGIDEPVELFAPGYGSASPNGSRSVPRAGRARV